jgi:hypothetical protein
MIDECKCIVFELKNLRFDLRKNNYIVVLYCYCKTAVCLHGKMLKNIIFKKIYNSLCSTLVWLGIVKMDANLTFALVVPGATRVQNIAIFCRKAIQETPTRPQRVGDVIFVVEFSSTMIKKNPMNAKNVILISVRSVWKVRKYLTVIGWGLCDMQKARNTY